MTVHPISEPTPPFRVALRGYDPAQVDRRVDELASALHEATRQRNDLILRVELLESELARSSQCPPAPVEPVVVEVPATFEHLGERIAKMLALAEDEGTAIRARAHDAAESSRSEVTVELAQLRADAERYADGLRASAETDAARIVGDAARAAEAAIDSAQRQAATRAAEAEALYEEQRARSAKAAADFEATLASRRQEAEEQFAHQLADANRRLSQAEATATAARTSAATLEAATQREAQRLLEDARAQATGILAEAKATAAQVRADSERELAAASQRRDSINAQLANVRQMLATLTGAAGLGPILPETVADAVVGVPEQGQRVVDVPRLETIE